MTDYSSRRTVLVLALGLALGSGACKTGGAGGAGGSEPVVSMGSIAAVGGLKYTVFQSEWRESLDSPQGPRTPKHKYLLLHLAVENTSTEETGIPMFRLVNEKGEEFDEESNGNGVTDWLGFLRTSKPSATERGAVVFDVPQTGYKLRVSSGGDDPEKEKTALIEIPLRVEVDSAPTPLPMEGAPGKK
jgi:hypothetical protein